MESANGRLSEDTLRKHFSNYGEVEEALILSDNDRGNERGFGYVTFKDPAGPIHALNQQHYILDTKLDVKPALRISSVTSLNRNTPPTVEIAGSSDNNKEIYVGGLLLHLTYRELKEHFESIGAVTNARVVYDEENKKSRGFGFVTFDSKDVVHNVLQKSDLEMENRLLMVGRADSDRNQGLIYPYDCNNTCLGSGRSDSETYGPYPPPAPQPPYAPPYGNYSWPSGTFPDVVSWNGLQSSGGLLPYANPAPPDNSTKDDNQPQMEDKSSMGNSDVNDK